MLFFRIDADKKRVSKIGLVGFLSRLVAGLKARGLDVARGESLHIRKCPGDRDYVGAPLDVAFICKRRNDNVACVFCAHRLDCPLQKPHENSRNDDKIEEREHHHKDNERGRPKRCAPQGAKCQEKSDAYVEGHTRLVQFRIILDAEIGIHLQYEHVSN